MWRTEKKGLRTIDKAWCPNLTALKGKVAERQNGSEANSIRHVAGGSDQDLAQNGNVSDSKLETHRRPQDGRRCVEGCASRQSRDSGEGKVALDLKGKLDKTREKSLSGTPSGQRLRAI